MICPQCKAAGQVLHMPVVSGRLDKVKALHRKCTNPFDCPCQHKLPEEIEISAES